MKKNPVPAGWTEEKIKRVIRHYEEQSDSAAMAEDEAAFKDHTQTFMKIPNKLVPSVRRLLARHAA